MHRKKHEENEDLRLIGRIGKVNLYNHTIEIPKSTNIGIRSWGRLDFLRHRGWYLVRTGSTVKTTTSNVNDRVSARDARKAAKEHKLTDKRK